MNHPVSPGPTSALTDDTGSVSDTYEYDVFGNIRTETGSSANEFTYTGEQNESTGLEYLRARYYDPEVGRFLSEDPLPLLQRYPYVGNSPTNLVDPDAKWPVPPRNPETGCGGFPGEQQTNFPCPTGPLPPWQPGYEGGGNWWLASVVGAVVGAALTAWDNCEAWAWGPASAAAPACYWDEIRDVGHSILTCGECQEIAGAVGTGLQCLLDPRVQAGAAAISAVAGPEAGVAAALGTCATAATVTYYTGVYPLNP